MLRLTTLFYLFSTATRLGMTMKAVGANCFKPQQNGYHWQRLDKYEDFPTACHEFFNPLAPKEANLDFSINCSEGPVALNWIATERFRDFLGGFLVKVEQERDGSIEAYYMRVNITINLTEVMKPEVFKYGCFDVKGVNKLNVWIWPLSTTMSKCDSPVFLSLNTNRDQAVTRCEAIKCVCKSDVEIQSFFGQEDGSVNAIIKTKNLPEGTEVQTVLERDNGTVVQAWASNEFKFTVKKRQVGAGEYYFRVFRKCKYHEYTKSVCRRSMAPVVGSKITVNHYNVGPDSIEASLGSESISVATLAVICSCLCFLILISLVLYIKFKLGVWKFGPKTKHRFINAQHIYHSIRGADTRKRVALIFAKDSTVHSRGVHRLATELVHHGINAVAIDEKTHREMAVNWIDSGENLPNNYDVMLFVMSPILYELCHRDAPGIVELVNTGHVIHRLPAVVLHTLRVNPYYKGSNVPKAIVVSLDKKPNESNPMLKAFLKEFKGVFHPAPIFMNDKSRGLEKLLKLIHGSACSNV